jgi:SMP-30/Gluconolactonase/LRE-like region
MTSSLTIDRKEMWTWGKGLNRPECVLTFESGDLVVSHKAAGVSHIRPDGSVTVVGHHSEVGGRELVPNGIALGPDRRVLLANIGSAGGLWALDEQARLELVAGEADGNALAAANAVAVDDRSGRIYVSVSTRRQPRFEAYSRDITDGFVALLGERGTHVVADNLSFPNELRITPDGRGLYVSETFGRRVTRFEIGPDGLLSNPVLFAEFGPGDFPDGIALDVEEHLWVTSIVSNRLYRVSPSGQVDLVFEDADAEWVAEVEHALLENRMRPEHFYTQGPNRLPNIASIAFGGPDRRTAYLGSLLGDTLVAFRSPVAGHPSGQYPADRLPGWS